MSWDDFKSVPDKTKEATFRSSNSNHFYCIFRVGKSFKTVDANMNKTLNQIKNFQKHMERETEVPNANIEIKNEILIGDKDIYGNVAEYIKDIKLRKDGVIAKELLLTASPDFFRGLISSELQRWKDDNLKWLKDNFKENLRYATLHKDEKTWHIHALIVPKFYNEKRKVYTLANKRYFGGAEKLREFQTNYSEAMKQHFKCLNRGIKFSKAKHMTIRHYYSLINQNLNEKDMQQLTAKAKNSELLEIKIKSIQKTLEVYKNYNSKNELQKDRAIQESRSLVKEIEKLKDDKEIYKDAISLLSQQYKIPQYAIKEVVRICENISEKENEK